MFIVLTQRTFVKHMSLKGYKIYSVLSNKCPHCHEGDFFVVDNPFNLKSFAKMYDKCPVCGQDFRREPGFYFGAAYVSYGLTVTIALILFVLLYLLAGLSAWTFLGVLLCFQVISMPFFFRTARLIWINWFVHYKAPLIKTPTIKNKFSE